VRLEPLKARRPTNAGVQRVAAAGEVAADGEPEAVKVRVTNAGESRRELFRLRWDGFQNVTNGVEIYVPPGQNRVVAAPARGPGTTPDRLWLSGDDEEFDNAVFVVAPPPRKTSILFFGTDREDDPAQLLYYARRAWQNTRQHQMDIFTRRAAEAVDDTAIAKASLLVISDSLSAGQAAQVAQAIDAGKTAVLVMRSAAAGETLGRLVGEAAVPVTEVATPGRYAMLTELDLQHPLLAPFADARFADFTKVHFWKHRRLPEQAVPGLRVLARFDDGSPALAQVPRGRGSLLVLASGWQPSDSQLALSTKFVPLLYSLLEVAGAGPAQSVEFRVGDPVDVFAFEGAGQALTLTVERPDGMEVSLARGQQFAATDLPGVYAVAGLSPPVRFAVNLAPEESRTAPLAAEQLSQLGVPVAAPTRLTGPRLGERRMQEHFAQLENRQKVWRWLIAAVLVVLMAETWLAGRAARQAARTAGGGI
jgi:hypothetical protein